MDDVGGTDAGRSGMLDGDGWRARAAWLSGLPLAPTLLAVVLALVTLPLTVLAMLSVESYLTFDTTAHLTLQEAFIGSIGAVLAGALAGGTLGGLFVRRHPYVGAVVALVVAWPAAVLGFALLPGLLHVPMTIGMTCLDWCSPALELSRSLSLGDVWARYVESVTGSLILFGMVTLVTGILAVLLGWLGGPPMGWIAGYVGIVVAVGSANAWSIGSSGISFLVLAAGVAAWATILAPRRAPPPAPPPVAESGEGNLGDTADAADPGMPRA